MINIKQFNHSSKTTLDWKRVKVYNIRDMKKALCVEP